MAPFFCCGRHPEQARQLQGDQDLAFLTVFTLMARHWNIARGETVQGYLWAWCENQVLAATKLVPLGQSSAQKILYRLAGEIPKVVEDAETLSDDDIGASLPGLSLASGKHETLYCRLFSS